MHCIDIISVLLTKKKYCVKCGVGGMSRDYRLRISSPYFLYLYVQKYKSRPMPSSCGPHSAHPIATPLPVSDTEFNATCSNFGSLRRWWGGVRALPALYDSYRPIGRTRVFENEWLISAMFSENSGRVLTNYWFRTIHNRQKMTEKHKSVNNVLWRV